MAKTTTSFQVCYVDNKGNKVIKNIKDITPEEKPNITKMYILRKGKTSEIGDFTSALKGFVNLETLYGPAGVASFKVKSLTKGENCPKLQTYVGFANEDDVYTAPKFVSSNGVAFNSEDTPSSVGAFASLSTDGEVVSGFVSADDFYNTIVKSQLGEAEPTSIVTFKVNPSKTDLVQGPKVPGTLRQKANEIKSAQETKENTTTILNIVSALKDNGVNLTKEQEDRLLNGFEAFVVANKGISREDAEAMKLNLQEDIYNIGVKIADISDDNAESINGNIEAGKNAILDRLQTMSKKAEQTSASDRAVNFAEHSKTRTVVANEAKRATQDTVSALKDYLVSASEAMNKALEAKLNESNKKLDAMNEKFDMIQNALVKLFKAQGQMKDEILGATSAQTARIEDKIDNRTNALKAEILSLAQVGRTVVPTYVPMAVAGQPQTVVMGQPQMALGANPVMGYPMAQAGRFMTEKDITDLVQKTIADNEKAKEEEAKKKAEAEKQKEEIAKRDEEIAQLKNKVEELSASKNEKSDGEKAQEKKVKVLKKTSDGVKMLAEPKLPWYKRMGKFIVRHPFRSMLMGLGAGALVATGVGAIALGGFAPAIATANAFFPTIAVGGVAGAGLGAVGSVASRFSSKGRRERAYTKFMKKYKKAQKKAEKIAEKDAELAQLDVKKQDLRAKDRSGNLFAKIGVYKAARRINRKVFRSTMKKKNKAIESYYNKIEQAGAYKRILNNMEAKSGVTTAHGGALQKRNKIDMRLKNNKINESEALEDKEELEFDYPGISEVGKDYKTGDTEMMDLYDNFKNPNVGGLSNRSSNMKRDIKKRNPSSKFDVKEEVVIAKEDDPNYKAQQEAIEAYKKAKEECLIDENDNYIEM